MKSKWAYHGTSIMKAYSNSQLRVLEKLSPAEIGETHLQNIAENGLVPKQSRRQTLSYRKSILGKRLKEKFVYFYSQPLDNSDIYMLASRYGDGLVVKNGGAILRFPSPQRYWQDPDGYASNTLITNQTILPENLQILTPPAKYYQLLAGEGNSSWSPWDLASRYLLQYCINSEKYWKPLLQDDGITNPWTNQRDPELDAIN